MRILEVNNFHYSRGGSEAVYFNTSKLLENNGHEVIHFSMINDENISSQWEKYFINNPNYLNSSAFNKVKSAKTFLYNTEAQFNLQKLIEYKKPDIAHLHLFYGGMTSSILKVLKNNKIPIVATLHDYKLLCPVYTFLDQKNNVCEKCISGKYYNCLIGKCNKRNFFYSLIIALESYFRDYFYKPTKFIDKFIFVSKFALNKHIEAQPALNKKSVHLYNFVPNIKVDSPKITKGSYFLYYGRLSYEKGIKTILDTFKDLPNFKLKIAGTGPLAGIVKLSDRANKNIDYLGYLTGDKLKEIVLNASFVIVPSEWYENNPMSIIETYALTKPVIASNIGGIPEIVVQGKTGYLFESKNKDSLKKILNMCYSIEDNNYYELCSNAYEYAIKEFSPYQHYKHLMKIFKSVL